MITNLLPAAIYHYYLGRILYSLTLLYTIVIATTYLPPTTATNIIINTITTTTNYTTTLIKINTKQ